MPIADNGPARIWWNASAPKEDGREAVVLIMGLGCSCDMWFRVAPELARRIRVIVLDNRGVGRTRVNGIAVVHRIDAMADDVAAVLNAAGERAAHIAGFSMGGMVAQQFALDHPDRTLSLTLMGTHPGAVHAVKARDEVLRLLFDKRNLSPQQRLDAMRPYVYAHTTHDERIDRDHELRLEHDPTIRGYQAQLYGLMAWSAYHRLSRIAARTLVVHGLDDALIPPANGRMLADRIPNARHEELRDASHWLFTDQTEETLALLSAFLSNKKARR
jgi:pimeloyl-ACP methyl ester carboxylesterase